MNAIVTAFFAALATAIAPRLFDAVPASNDDMIFI